jgi:hypothetical protein
MRMPEYVPESPAMKFCQCVHCVVGVTFAVNESRYVTLTEEHVPEMHLLPLPHAVPQLPQFPLSVCVSVQYAPASPFAQSVSPLPHVELHVPPPHARPLPHTCPHEPQLASSVAVVAQYAPASPVQSVCPLPHVALHTPDTHARPLLHAWPHVPQSVLLALVSAQYGGPASGVHNVSAPPSAAPHVAVHVPCLQTCD